MNYREFKQQFEEIFQEKAQRFPNALSYMRSFYKHSPASTFSYITIGYLRKLADKDDSFWERFDRIISDILQALKIDSEQLFDTGIHSSYRRAKNFQFPYEVPFYPVKEHLYYIEFEPAIERERFIRKQLKEINTKDIRFCDLGFGPGVLLTLTLQEKLSWRGYGIDISLQCARYAYKMLALKGVDHRVELCVADVRYLPFADATFDLVLGMEVFEHISNPFEGLSELVRTLKPGGYAITSIPVKLQIPEHLYVFSDTHEVLSLYKKVGLQILNFETKKFNIGRSYFTDTFALCLK